MPCQLVEILSRIDVLITPHGFQNTLLMYLPVASILVEVYPRFYFTPVCYGGIQTILRYTHGANRVLFGEESPSHGLMGALLSLVHGTGLFSYEAMTSSPVGRYFIRL